MNAHRWTTLVALILMVATAATGCDFGGGQNPTPNLCTTDADCVDGGVCDPATFECVECLLDADCPLGKKCDGETHQCVGCLADADCEGDLVCDSTLSLCVECLEDADCGDGGHCDEAMNVCVECVDDVDCAYPDAVCALSACIDGECVTGDVPDGLPCLDGDPCTLDDKCDEGECIGGALDPECGEQDLDGDGFTPAEGDCDDTDAEVNPAAAEICGDNKDNDCDGIVDNGCNTGCESDADCPLGESCEIVCGNGWCEGVCVPDNPENICEEEGGECIPIFWDEPGDGGFCPEGMAEVDLPGCGGDAICCLMVQPLCVSAADCDDGDECTFDFCMNGECVYEENPDCGPDDCWSDFMCGPAQYCAFPGCFSETGTCMDIPEFCPEYYAPVCGCDDVTYDNICFLQAASQSLAYDGACEGTVVDQDGDGWTTEEGDCDDGNAMIHPGAQEVCYDGKDNDCDGQVDEGCGSMECQSDDDCPDGYVCEIFCGNGWCEGTCVPAQEPNDCEEAGGFCWASDEGDWGCPPGSAEVDLSGCGIDEICCMPEEPDCVPEGESFTTFGDPTFGCCEGLTAIIDAWYDEETGMCNGVSNALVCTYCGNGYCGLGENPCNCPEDCSWGTECIEIDPAAYGMCAMFIGVGFDGEECVYISGCGCGSDPAMPSCDGIFETMEDCTMACLIGEGFGGGNGF